MKYVYICSQNNVWLFKIISVPDKQNEAQESFVFQFITLPKAKIKVIKYKKKPLYALNIGPKWLTHAFLHIVSMGLTFEPNFIKNLSKNVGNMERTRNADSNA